MKGKTIIGLVLAATLLLVGTVAYGYWNDNGPKGNYGAGYGYRCVYGQGTGYNSNVKVPASRTFIPCSGYWHGKGNWNNHDYRHGYGKGWPGHRGYGMTGLRRCW
jgi:hypothetical protein